MKKASKTKIKDNYPIIEETFTDISGYYIHTMIKNKPTCFNGNVSVERYRITVERIKESTEVYSERLNKLWAECDNYHHWGPLQIKAKELGVILIGERGRDKNKSKP